MAELKSSARFVVSLGADQWDLVVLALKYVDARAATEMGVHSALAIDRFSRKVVRRRIAEVLEEIRSNIPDAGKD